MQALLAALLATTITYGLTALGAGIVLLWVPSPGQMQTVMALAVGLMLAAVFDLFVSADEEAKEIYGHSAVASIPLVVGVAIATATLVALEKFCFSTDMSEHELHHEVDRSELGDAPSDCCKLQQVIVTCRRCL